MKEARANAISLVKDIRKNRGVRKLYGKIEGGQELRFRQVQS